MVRKGRCGAAFASSCPTFDKLLLEKDGRKRAPRPTHLDCLLCQQTLPIDAFWPRDVASRRGKHAARLGCKQCRTAAPGGRRPRVTHLDCMLCQQTLPRDAFWVRDARLRNSPHAGRLGCKQCRPIAPGSRGRAPRAAYLDCFFCKQRLPRDAFWLGDLRTRTWSKTTKLGCKRCRPLPPGLFF